MRYICLCQELKYLERWPEPSRKEADKVAGSDISTVGHRDAPEAIKLWDLPKD